MAGERVLVTGGAGFLGRAIARSLLAAGATVRLLDDFSRGRREDLGGLERDAELVQADVRDAEAVRLALRGADAVVHLAAVNGTENFYKNPALVLEVAVKGIVHVVDGCAAEGVKDLLVASSSEVYQDPPRVPTDERVPLVVPDPLNPRYSYGGGKILTELYALHFGRARLRRAIIFRPHNVYGPAMGGEHVIPQFVLRMASMPAGPDPLPFPIEGTGEETRSFVHVDDLAAGVRLLHERGEHLGIYHIGRREEVKIRVVAEKVARCMGRRIEVVAGPRKAGSPMRRCPDTTRIEALGYRSRISLDEGLPGVVEWYVKNSSRWVRA